MHCECLASAALNSGCFLAACHHLSHSSSQLYAAAISAVANQRRRTQSPPALSAISVCLNVASCRFLCLPTP